MTERCQEFNSAPFPELSSNRIEADGGRSTLSSTSALPSPQADPFIPSQPLFCPSLSRSFPCPARAAGAQWGAVTPHYRAALACSCPGSHHPHALGFGAASSAPECSPVSEHCVHLQPGLGDAAVCSGQPR